MFALRVIFAAYLALMLVWYVPAHQRGKITLGKKSESVQPTVQPHACCAPKPVNQKKEPTDSDRRACFVCFWVAGLIVVEPFTLQLEFHELAYASARQYDAQVRAVADRLNHYGRDPPFAC